LLAEFILILCETNYKRRPHAKARFSFDRTTSVAAMQEWARDALPNCRGPARALQLSLEQVQGRSIRLVAGCRSPWGGVDRVQQACKMQYDAGARRLKPRPRAMRRYMATCDNEMADTDEKIFIGKGEAPAWLTLALANRHGLVTGATGTGKTVSLQVMAEGFARAGVPVFAADIKGDLFGISEAGGAQGFYRQAGRRYGPQLPARPVFDRVRSAAPWCGARSAACCGDKILFPFCVCCGDVISL
jgi:hypothetical protein